MFRGYYLENLLGQYLSQKRKKKLQNNNELLGLSKPNMTKKKKT